MLNVTANDVKTVSIHGLGQNGSATLVTVPSGQTWTVLSASVERGEKSPHTFITDTLHPTFMTSIVHTSGDAFVYFDGAQRVQGTVQLEWTGAQNGTHHWGSITYVQYDLSTVADDYNMQSVIQIENSTTTENAQTMTIVLSFFLIAFIVGTAVVYMVKKLI